MRHFNLLFLVLLGGLFFNVYAQNQPSKSGTTQQKVVCINPVKPDTTDPNKKALNKFSKEKMFNVAPPASN
jgi:hypothetical protein